MSLRGHTNNPASNVPCPTCLVDVGVRCKTKKSGSKMVRFHKARMRFARETEKSKANG
jgi:hypothetical protein